MATMAGTIAAADGAVDMDRARCELGAGFVEPAAPAA
jgi:hypothetical protein